MTRWIKKLNFKIRRNDFISPLLTRETSETKIKVKTLFGPLCFFSTLLTAEACNGLSESRQYPSAGRRGKKQRKRESRIHLLSLCSIKLHSPMEVGPLVVVATAIKLSPTAGLLLPSSLAFGDQCKTPRLYNWSCNENFTLFIASSPMLTKF